MGDGKCLRGLKLYHFSALLPSSGLHCGHFWCLLHLWEPFSPIVTLQSVDKCFLLSWEIYHLLPAVSNGWKSEGTKSHTQFQVGEPYLHVPQCADGVSLIHWCLAVAFWELIPAKVVIKGEKKRYLLSIYLVINTLFEKSCCSIPVKKQSLLHISWKMFPVSGLFSILSWSPLFYREKAASVPTWVWSDQLNHRHPLSFVWPADRALSFFPRMVCLSPFVMSSLCLVTISVSFRSTLQISPSPQAMNQKTPV